MHKRLLNICCNLEGKDSPEKFKRIYLLLAFSCLLLTLFSSWLVITRHTQDSLIADAIIDSEKIVSSLLSSEKTALQFLPENGSTTLAISPSEIPTFDKRVRAFLQPLSIVKIKIYNHNMRIIYCTEQSLTGKLDLNNQRLKKTISSSGPIQTVIKNRQSITDLSEEKRFEVDVAEVYVPIKDSNGHVAGVFEVYTDISNINTNFKQQLSSSLTMLFLSLLLLSTISYFVINHISTSLSKAYNQLEILASNDSLTGIFNRGKLLLHASQLYEMMQRSNNKFSDGVGIGIVMIDVDHFKNVNDSYGHLVGDDVLRIITKRVESVLRPYDVFGRYGGEEFLIFLPTTRFEEAKQIANRILYEINGQPFYVGDLSINMTVSIGCAWTDAKEENLDKVLSRVDTFMYAAKNNGRNQVVDSPLI